MTIWAILARFLAVSFGDGMNLAPRIGIKALSVSAAVESLRIESGGIVSFREMNGIGLKRL